MVKKMVRLALACEYSRLPIRRADVGVKGVLVFYHKEGNGWRGDGRFYGGERE